MSNIIDFNLVNKKVKRFKKDKKTIDVTNNIVNIRDATLRRLLILADNMNFDVNNEQFLQDLAAIGELITAALNRQANIKDYNIHILNELQDSYRDSEE